MGFLFDGIFSPMRKCFSAGTIKIFCRLLWKRRLANAVHVNVLERCVLASSEQAMSGSSEEKLRLKKKKKNPWEEPRHSWENPSTSGVSFISNRNDSL